MRYGSNENAVLVGIFGKKELDVRMKIITLEGDILVELVTDKCIESSHMEGVYLFNTENIKDDSIVGYTNMLAEMRDVNDLTTKRYAKFTFGGIVDDKTEVNLETIKELLEKLNTTSNYILMEVA